MNSANDAANNDGQTNWSERYTITSLLAEGERTLLYVAVDQHVNRRVVLKRIRAELTYSQEHKQLFQEEAKLFAESNVSGLVKILDFDFDSCMLVLERMSRDLSSLVGEMGIGINRSCDILRDALNGLCWLHTRGVAHGRVELKHLLMDDMGGVKLSVTPGMIGCAPTLRPSANVSHLAPELLNKHVFGQPDLAVDIYALGFVILELLCGKRLASKVSPTVDTSDNGQSWLLWHASATEHLPPISQLVPGIPRHLELVLQRMTNKLQHERFQTAMQVLEFMQAANGMSEPGGNALTSDAGHEDAAVELLGTPPNLQPAYDHEDPMTWQRILKNPSNLLRADARSQQLQLVIGLMIVASFLLIFSTPGPAKPDTVAAAPAEVAPLGPPPRKAVRPKPELPKEPNVAPAPVRDPVPPRVEKPVEEESYIEFRVLPFGKVVSVANVTASKVNPHKWPLKQGTYTVTGIDLSSQQAFDTRVAIPEYTGRLEVTINVPTFPKIPTPIPQNADPYEDVRHKRFVPVPVSFPIQGAANEQSKKQSEAIHRAIGRLSLTHLERTAGATLYELPERPVDPRASFALALNAFSANQLDRARDLCRRSLADARHFEVPFVLPLRLLTQVELGRGQSQVALGACHATYNWVHSQVRNRRPEFLRAEEEVAWWTGNVIGYLVDSRARKVNHTTNAEELEQLIRQTASREVWEKYRIARCTVDSRVEELKVLQAENRYAAELKLDRQQSTREQQSKLFWDYLGANRRSKPEQTSSSSREKDRVKTFETVSTYSWQSGDADYSADHPVDRPAGNPVGAAAERAWRHPTSPLLTKFDSVQPCDLLFLGDTTLSTVGNSMVTTVGSTATELSTWTRPVRE